MSFSCFSRSAAALHFFSIPFCLFLCRLVAGGSLCSLFLLHLFPRLRCFWIFAAFSFWFEGQTGSSELWVKQNISEGRFSFKIKRSLSRDCLHNKLDKQKEKTLSSSSLRLQCAAYLPAGSPAAAPPAPARQVD